MQRLERVYTIVPIVKNSWRARTNKSYSHQSQGGMSMFDHSDFAGSQRERSHDIFPRRLLLAISVDAFHT